MKIFQTQAGFPELVIIAQEKLFVITRLLLSPVNALGQNYFAAINDFATRSQGY